MLEYEIGPCRPDELPALADLTNRVFRVKRGGDMSREYPLLFDPANAANLRVARRDGVLVSHVGICLRDVVILGARIRVASIGAVATDPAHRGGGLATRLMDDARNHAIAGGASLMLISGDRGLYKRLGYVETGVFEAYTIPSGPVSPDVMASSFRNEDLPALIRLYQSEPVRFLRPASDWGKVLEAGMLMNQPADLHVIRRGAEVLAYAAVQRPAADHRVVRVREVAGSRSALAAALPGIARGYGLGAAETIHRPDDAEWRLLAARNGWEARPCRFTGTVGIIDPPRFLAAVRPLLEERCGGPIPAPPADTSTLTRALFDAEPPPGEFTDALRTALPLPLLWYGFNYV